MAAAVTEAIVSMQFSRVIATEPNGDTSNFSMKAFNLRELGEVASPVLHLDDFIVSGRPFPPHPHAGFAAVTYVFEDSPGGLRSRDSLGNDWVTGPGGIVWTHAGSGMIHHEVPAETGRPLHGLQIFVNLSSKNKLTAPRLMRLTRSEVPEWRGSAGDRVRVLVGSFEGITSPLVPMEPFTLLDVELRNILSLSFEAGHNALVYTVDGDVIVRTDGRRQDVKREQSMAIYGAGGVVTFESVRSTHCVVLSGPQIREPVIADGPFIMNDSTQIKSAFARYRAGEMGHLEPLS